MADEHVIVFDLARVFLLTRPGMLDRRMTAWQTRPLAVWTDVLDDVLRPVAQSVAALARLRPGSSRRRGSGSL